MASSLPILRCRQFQGCPLSQSPCCHEGWCPACLARSLTSCPTRAWPSPGWRGLCVWKRGDVEQRFIVGSCSLLPCSFFWVHFKVYSEDLQDLRWEEVPNRDNQWNGKSFPTLTEKVISDHHSCAVGKENYRTGNQVRGRKVENVLEQKHLLH